MIVLKNIVKSFGRHREFQVINNVSFTVENGQITGLLGPNGAGKTTLLRIIATLMTPDSGSITVDGHDVLSDGNAVRRNIGVLSDSRGIYPRLTARENIKYFGELQGLPGDFLEARIEELLRALRITSIADRMVEGFSQGERMKVAIARALVHDPNTILLDEPTNGLDIMSIRSLRDLLRDLHGNNKCVLFSSHVMQEVSALCHRIVILGCGRVIATGTSSELIEQSAESSLEDAFLRLLGSGEGMAP
jgi:sodium transport system ATP-binding protein